MRILAHQHRCAHAGARGGVGRFSTILGLYSMRETHMVYLENLNQGYGPNMIEYLNNKYKADQIANGTGFLGFFGGLLSIGYNIGYAIEDICKCNIQYNPFTKDFTPIEKTLMMYDNMGVDLTK